MQKERKKENMHFRWMYWLFIMTHMNREKQSGWMKRVKETFQDSNVPLKKIEQVESEHALNISTTNSFYENLLFIDFDLHCKTIT